MKYMTISSLPGGNQNYLNVLRHTLAWLHQSPDSTYTDLIDFFVETYNVIKSSAGNYARQLKNLNVIQQTDDKIELTAVGKTFLDLSSPEQNQLILETLMSQFIGVADILWIYHQSERPMHINDVVNQMRYRFPTWQSNSPAYHRVLWLSAIGCLQKQRGQTYVITEMGRESVHMFPLDSTDDFAPSPTSSYPDEVNNLIERLQHAARDGTKPQTLETVLAEVFRQFGFQTTEAGGRGDTDLILNAPIGLATYRVIVEAKVRGTGALHELSVFALLEHAQRNQANHIVVVADTFSDGRITRQALEHHITLLPVPMLVSWLRLHTTTPLDLLAYREIFETHGMVTFIPTGIIEESKRRQDLSRLVADILMLMEETYRLGLNETIPTEQIMGMLVTKLRGVYYTRAQVNHVIDFLRHPLVRVMIEENGGNILSVDRWAVVKILRALATQIEQELIPPVSPNPAFED